MRVRASKRDNARCASLDRRRAGALGARRHLPEHRELRAAAAPRVGRLQSALDDWRTGRTSWEHWGDATEAARASFARLVGCASSSVAVGATVSGLVGLVAASLPAGSRVLAPEIEFTSTLFPFLVQERRGVSVRTVPAAGLAAAIDETTDVVAFSAVQMATGEVADLTGIAAAARRARRADRRRRHPGLRLAPTRRRPGSTSSSQRGTNGSSHRAAPPTWRWTRPAGRHRADGSRVVCRRGRPRHLLRRRRCASRATRAGSTRRRRGTAGSEQPCARPARGDRRRRDPRARPSARQPLPGGPRPGSRPTPRLVFVDAPDAVSGSNEQGSGLPSATGGCGRPGTSTTPRRMSTGL